MKQASRKSSRQSQQWIIGITVTLVVALPLVYSAIVVPLSPAQQAYVSLAMIVFALVASLSRTMRPLIIFLSCFASMRYFYWRIGSTLNLDSGLDAVVSVVLLGAEIYGLMILFLGYFQTIEVQKRKPVPLQRQPTVDILIPTYNESTDIVRRTVIGALAIDYPFKTVYVLDDGRRPEVEVMARTLGASYVTRPNNHHAKAGNLNHALGMTTGELIAIFDADHVPVRGFLNRTLGFFEDPKVALVQTAQHFFNPDPYERNLNLIDRIAPEQHFFYHVIQPGNDFWNAAFFCGSCAVLRRSAIEEIGGIKTKTVTEDAHTALELHSRGYLSIYLPLPLAAGLATETFAAHVKQRIRWARGMAQILRIDCPLLKKGLSIPQRLNYFNAMIHFFFGIPRLIMVVAPLTFLLFGIHPIKANAVAVIAYILPHIGLSTIANSIISKNFRHSFWAGVYEVSIAPYTAGVTVLALLNPGLGKFNVTDKGTNLDRARYDFQTSWFTLTLLALSVVGLMVAFPLRMLFFIWQDGPSSELDSILINSAWAVANLFTLVAAACVAYEQPQQRKAPRVKRDFPCELLYAGDRLAGRSLDLSESGISVALDHCTAVPDQCVVSISSPFGTQALLRASRVWSDWNADGRVKAAFKFVEPGGVTHQTLVQLMFSADDSWIDQKYETDKPWRSFWYLLTTLWRVTKLPRARVRQAPRIHGQWPAWFDGLQCQCSAVSATGGLIRFPANLNNVRGQGKFRMEIQPGRALTVDQARILPVGEGVCELALQFDWPAFSVQRSFSEALYRAGSALQPQSPKGYWWKWIEELR
jgi:cellulose synthase (UDP-forming)